MSEILKKMPKAETIYDLAELYKVFGDATRTKILCVLSIKDMKVNELSKLLNMTISAISHQLRVLRTAKLIKGKKMGKEVVYSLDDNHVIMILECGLSHVKEKRNERRK